MSGALPMVPDSKLDFDSDLRCYYRDKPFTGIAYEDKPGAWRFEITYRDGYQEGPTRDWHKNDELSRETWYYGSMRHGPHREFRPDGTLATEEHYEYGICVASREFDASRTVIRETVLKPSDSEFARLEAYRREWAWPAPQAH